MRRLLFLTLLACVARAQVSVEIRDNEVWLIRSGQSKQLTRDGTSKLQVLPSRDFNRIAYYEQCAEGENCTPSVIVLDPDGNRLHSFQPSPSALFDPGPCGSILRISWTSRERAIGVECHLNPSLSEYVEIELATGKTRHHLAGSGFTPSPVGDHIAYVAPIVHFATPNRQSNYLVLDDLTVYPLPRGGKPNKWPIEVVRQIGSRFVGIHNFASSLSWSPDSKKVAFIDCVSDWIEAGTDPGGCSIGELVDDKCSVAVVRLDGSATLFPLAPDVPLNGFNSAESPRLSWNGNSVVLTGPVTKTFRIP